MSLLYKFRIYLIFTAAVLIIVLAVAFTALRAFIPYATDYTKDVEARLSQEIGLPVKLDSFDADMHWLTPRLKLLNLVIYDANKKKELLYLDEVILSLSYIESLLNLSPRIGDISLVGADLYFEKHPENRWKVQGVEIVGGDVGDSSGTVTEFINNTSFSLLDSDVHWRDYTGKKESMDFVGVNLIVESFIGGHAIQADINLPAGYGDRFRLVATTDSKLEAFEGADWQVYVEGKSIEIDNWLKRFQLQKDMLVDGKFDGKVWMTLSASKVQHITSQFLINKLKLRDAKNNLKRWDAQQLSGTFDWKLEDNGWQLNYRDFKLTRNAQKWSLPSHGDVSNNGQVWQASSSYFRVQDIVSFSGLFSSDLAGEAEQSFRYKDLLAMGLEGDFYNTSFSFSQADLKQLAFYTDFLELELKLPGEDIELEGVDGQLKFEKGSAELVLMSEAVKMDFGDLFRQPLQADVLQGDLAIIQAEDGWLLSSPSIYIQNQDIAVRSRLDLQIRQQEAMFIDLQSDFKNVSGSSAYKYYPVSIMSSKLVSWLDKSITDGHVDQGSFILYGDTDSFPYRGNEGVMEVVFDVRDMNLQFNEDWPLINDLAGHLRFYDSSLAIEAASGRSYRGRMNDVEGIIADFHMPLLNITGDIHAPAEDVQTYIWNSDLDAALGASMKQLEVAGMVDIKLALNIPLSADGTPVETQGNVRFNKNEIRLPVMQYTFEDAEGELSFTGSTLRGEGLTASFMGEPVSIDVLTNKDELNASTVFNLSGRLSADGLLSRFKFIPDHWLTGSSYWDVVFTIPKNTKQYPLHIVMGSTLQGVGINASKALYKEHDELMPVSFDLQMLPDTLQFELDSKDLVSVFASRDDNAQWDFIIDSEYLRGSGQFDESFSKTTTVSLNMERANLSALISQPENNREPASVRPETLPSLDIKVKNMSWDDWKFHRVNLVTNWMPQGMSIESLDLKADSLNVEAHGTWKNSWRNEHETNLKLRVNSDDLGRALTSLGLTDRLIETKQTASMSLQWPAEPYHFSLLDLSGSAYVKLEEGEVKDVEPGAGGRLLGLFNVFKLGERLKLNFGDVYREGFTFDSAEGDFTFQDGNAVTSNMELKAAPADIRMLGRVGLVEQDYDLVMQVSPHSSAAAATVGTLAGGPVIGTTLVVINKLLRLDKLAYDEYQVTGSWDSPKVDLLTKRDFEDELDESVQEISDYD